MNEKNPFLGLRAVRFSLKNHEVFTKQLRAMFRAAVGKKLKIMFPLVASVDEYRQAKEFALRCLAEIDAEGIPRCEEVRLGIMVELPSAVEMIEELVEESEFLSIGTNDLVQYLVGIDRTNEHVADLYTPYHPSVLRALYRVIKAAVDAGREISVCGDAGSNPDILRFLIGCGLTKVSVDPRRIQLVKKSIASISYAEAVESVPELLACRTVAEVRSRCER
jgi:phosphoenolpyruvate-protein kinase (PTS system EI component)